VAPTDSDFPPLVGAIIATHGTTAARRWLAALKRNAQLYQSDESVVAAVNRGDVATGLINHYYWYRLQLELGKAAMHSAVYYFPNHDVGTIENISGAAMRASSTHRQAAQAFLRFLVGPTAQELLARGDDFEYPVRPGIAPNPALQPLRTISPATLPVTRLGDDQQAARLIQQSGLV
jgi:iron(III) transport system substrate-binding protein